MAAISKSPKYELLSKKAKVELISKSDQTTDLMRCGQRECKQPSDE